MSEKKHNSQKTLRLLTIWIKISFVPKWFHISNIKTSIASKKIAFKHSDSIIQLVLSPKGAPPNEVGGLTNQGPVQRPEAEIPQFKNNFQGAG